MATHTVSDRHTYTLILVDDEPAILEGLAKTFDWEAYGFAVAGTARSGEKALADISLLQPDVVVTDIRMRKMDGLELIRRAQSIYPGLEFVIISAHDDFTYAQEACSLGVFSYLLKPIEEDQIREVMTRLHGKCAGRRDETLRIDRYREFIDTRRHDLEELLLKRFITGSIGSEELGRHLLRLESHIDIHKNLCAVCLDIGVTTRILREIDSDTHRFIATRSFVEHLSHIYDTWSIELRDGRVVVVLSARKEELEGDEIVNGLLKRVTEETGREIVTATHGGFKPGLAGLKESVWEAAASFEYTIAVGTVAAGATAGSRYALPAGDSRYPREESLQIIRSIRSNEPGSACEYLRQFGYSLSRVDRVTRRFLYQRLCNDIGRYLIESPGAEGSDLEKLVRFSEHVFRLSDDEMVRLFESLIKEIIENRQEYQISSTEGRYDSRIQDALLYVEQHFQDEGLTVDRAARYVYLNAAYFGRLFKQTVGVSFNELVARRRIDEAAELLQSTDSTVQQIAERVGIPNSSYFSAQFKKQKGVSPTEYRRA